VPDHYKNTGGSDHDFLDLRPGAFGDRTELGFTRLSTRSSLFVLFGMLSIAAFIAMYIYVDHRVAGALESWRSSQTIAALVSRAETGVARIKSQEKQFLLSKDAASAQAFEDDIKAIAKGLDDLYQMPETVEVRSAIATIRDGLVQYDEQFGGVVSAEREIGMTSDTGLTAALEQTSKTLQALFRQSGYDNLADQISRINREGKEALLSGSRQGVIDVRKRYDALHAFLKDAELQKTARDNAEVLLKSHETSMLSMINRRFAIDGDTQRFNDIINYVTPALEQVSGFSEDLTRSATKGLDRVQVFARYTLAGGSAAIVLWLILAGLFLMRSMVNGVRTVASASSRLANGDRDTVVPGMGNVDSVGQIARALDKWSFDLVELDKLRRELELIRKKLLLAEEHAAQQTASAVAAAKAAFLNDAGEPDAGSSKIPAHPASTRKHLSASAQQPAADSERGEGPISSLSRKVASFSEYVTAAAIDVERTEGLVRGLKDAGSNIEVLGNLVTSVRDQINLLAFHTHARDSRPSDPENLIAFNEESRQPAAGTPFPDRETLQRFDGIRESTEKAERTMQAVRGAMETVSTLANEIASTASVQALDATNKLLEQSAYLQSMLDEILSRIPNKRDVRQDLTSLEKSPPSLDPTNSRKA